MSVVILFLTLGFHFGGSHSHVRFLSMYLPILTTILENPESHQVEYQTDSACLLMAFLLAYL